MNWVNRIVYLLITTVLPVWSQITLPNGVTVPRERMIVFLFAGHSNMAGRHNSSDLTEHPRCWAYRANNTQGWRACKDLIFENATGAGPATPFLKDLAARYPDFHFGVIQNARSALVCNGNYMKGQDRYNSLMQYARELQGKVTFGGIVTMLGIIERVDGSRNSRFGGDMTQMIKDMRTELGLSAERLPALVQDYERDACNEDGSNCGERDFRASCPGAQIIIQQLSGVPAQLPYSRIVPTSGIPCPDQCHHFSNAGFREFAKRGIDYYRQQGWDFWATATDTQAPTKPGTPAVAGKTQTTIAITWTAAQDNVGIQDYVVTYGTNLTKTVAGTVTSTILSDLSACASYTIRVAARDFSGNSSVSDPVTVSTECGGDTVRPSTPGNLALESRTAVSATVTWNNSTDNVGVTGYEVFRDGDLSGATAANVRTYTVTGLTPATRYVVTARAFDAAGNRSLPSAGFAVTTLDRAFAPIPLHVNIGGNHSGTFLSDKSWTEGSDFGHVGTGSLTVCATDPVIAETVPADILRCVRHKNFAYRAAVPNGTYLVSLLFAEFWRTQAGTRTFDVKMEGRALPQGRIDIYAAAGAGREYRILTSAAVTDEYLDIDFTGIVSDPILSGLIVEKMPVYRITSPRPGEQYRIGQTLPIRWIADTVLVHDAIFRVSDDQGLNWYSIMPGKAITTTDPAWGTFDWVIPASLPYVGSDGSEKMVELSGKDLLLRVTDYDSRYEAVLDTTFNIVKSSAVAADRSPQPANPRALRGGLRRLFSDAGRIEILRADGSIAAVVLPGEVETWRGRPDLAAGVVFVRSGSRIMKIPLLR